ncbi:hypothetical protein CEXT_326151 [Caerostris extrusa]|uniref:Uncharacterized protein n=1 Tax=Caerostris extrusa TaxID=172846 RepID=A0AAV4PFZ2_CAEEX|nr:hypothetical protein CEXT_326151 [Caerostris extrusa]
MVTTPEDARDNASTWGADDIFFFWRVYPEHLHSAENPHQGRSGCFFFWAISSGEASGIGRLWEMQLVSAIPAEGRFVVRLYFSEVSYQGLWKNTKTV